MNGAKQLSSLFFPGKNPVISNKLPHEVRPHMKQSAELLLSALKEIKNHVPNNSMLAEVNFKTSLSYAKSLLKSIKSDDYVSTKNKIKNLLKNSNSLFEHLDNDNKYVYLAKNEIHSMSTYLDIMKNSREDYRVATMDVIAGRDRARAMAEPAKPGKSSSRVSLFCSSVSLNKAEDAMPAHVASCPEPPTAAPRSMPPAHRDGSRPSHWHYASHDSIAA